MKLNVKAPQLKTYEGGVAKSISVEAQLRRSVMCHMLWENEFYESGIKITDRIKDLVPKVAPEIVSQIAIDARDKSKLRHLPLYLVSVMCEYPTHRKFVAKTLEHVVQRADELTEFLAIYWEGGKKKLSYQIKKGLRKAFTKFNAYNLAKYNRDGAVKLRDVMFMVHPKPIDKEQEEVFKKLAANTLESADTWEVKLSATEGENKKEAWEGLLKENKLGAMALIRNLRNFNDLGISKELVKTSFNNTNAEKVLPFRYLTAARHAVNYEPELEQMMFKSIQGREKLAGTTIILIDVSSSMESTVSGKSEVTRVDAACGVAILLKETCTGEVIPFTFSNSLAQVPSRRGFALRDAIITSQAHGGTELRGALQALSRVKFGTRIDRVIIITDEQSSDGINDPGCEHAYVINVASAKNGVGYHNWTHIDGWSEAVVDFIIEFEKNKENYDKQNV